MSRRPARCTEADIKRAIKALLASGAYGAVEISPTGEIRVAVNGINPVPASPPKRRIAL